MKRLATTVSLLLISGLLPVGLLPAQDTKALDISLTPLREVVLAGGDVELKLRIKVTADQKLDAALINGLHLSSTIDGKKGPKVGTRGSGKISLRAGTTIERVLKFGVQGVIKNPSTSDVTRLSLQWVGRPELSASVSVAPDLRRVDVSQLDLSKTRVLLVTNHGDMLLRFFPDKAPKHVEAFIKLSKDGFYDSTRFHRIVRGFMIQGGCPNSKPGANGTPGTGGPGYTLKAEFNDIRHVRGVLSMARGGSPDSAGSQFFIVHQEASSLNGQYTAFGELVEGLDTLDKIAGQAVGQSPGGEKSRPLQPVVLKAAVVQPVFKAR